MCGAFIESWLYFDTNDFLSKLASSFWGLYILGWYKVKAGTGGILELLIKIVVICDSCEINITSELWVLCKLW